jgi:hypothetical protein
MENELFADSIGEISVTGAVVRIDLASLSPTERDADKKPKPVFRQRVVMPVEGFVQSFALMAQVMQQLEKTGVIKKAPAKGDKPTADVKPHSPNFK